MDNKLLKEAAHAVLLGAIDFEKHILGNTVTNPFDKGDVLAKAWDEGFKKAEHLFDSGKLFGQWLAENEGNNEEEESLLDEYMSTEESLLQLIAWLAGVVMKQLDCRREAIALPPEQCKDYLLRQFPIVQGTHLQNTLRKIAKHPTDQEKLKEALNYFEECLNEQTQSGEGVDPDENL